MSSAAYTTPAALLAIRDALKVLRGWLPEPQHKAGSVEYDKAIVYARRKHNEATAALTELEAQFKALVEADNARA